MWMILKTFKLSKNPLVHLFYLILIVTTVSHQADEQPAGPTNKVPDENINDVTESTDPILSNVDKGSTINDELEAKKRIIKRFLESTRTTPTIKSETNNIDPKESNIHVEDNKIEDQKQDIEENSFGSQGLTPKSATPAGDLEPEEKNIEAEKDQRFDPEQNTIENTQVTTESTIHGVDLEPEEKNIDAEKDQIIKKQITKKKKRKRNKKKTESIPKQDVNENDSQSREEKKVRTSETVEFKILSTSDPEQNPIENTQVTPESTIHGGDLEPEEKDQRSDPEQNTIENTQDTPESIIPVGDLEPEEKNIEEENAQNIKEGIKSSEKSEINLESPHDKSHPLEPIDPKDLTLSPLDNVEIVKIKGNLDPVSEAKRKEKKRNIFKEFAPTEGNARIYCTFLGNVLKMYKKVKKRFIGQFCHAIVFGTPLILKQNRVHLGENMRNQLRSIHSHKELSLLIVIMQYLNYNNWVHVLSNTQEMNILVIDIIHTVIHYKIDGIQFSNLYPIKGADQIDTHMMNNLIKFFEQLKIAAKNKNHDLKIGVTLDVHGLSITKSFTSFKDLNDLVTWYSFKSISMVKCSSGYKTTGTSPLEGNMGFKTTINKLIEQINGNNNFDMTKLVVGIQLFPNKEDEFHSYTYEEFCSNPKNTWHTWCAAKPEDLRLKGRFLRGTQIGGVQLYYMHSDDYRATCGCYSFPLIRALLRGLIKVETPETCDFEEAHN